MAAKKSTFPSEQAILVGGALLGGYLLLKAFQGDAGSGDGSVGGGGSYGGSDDMMPDAPVAPIVGTGTTTPSPIPEDTSPNISTPYPSQNNANDAILSSQTESITPSDMQSILNPYGQLKDPMALGGSIFPRGTPVSKESETTLLFKDPRGFDVSVDPFQNKIVDAKINSARWVTADPVKSYIWSQMEQGKFQDNTPSGFTSLPIWEAKDFDMASSMSGKTPIYDDSGKPAGVYDAENQQTVLSAQKTEKQTSTGLLGTGISLSQFSLGALGMGGSYFTAAGETIAKKDGGTSFLQTTMKRGIESIPIVGSKAVSYISKVGGEKAGETVLKRATKTGIGLVPFVGTAAGAEFDVRVSKKPRPVAYAANTFGDVLGGLAGTAGSLFSPVGSVAGAVGGQIGGEKAVYSFWDLLTGKDKKKKATIENVQKSSVTTYGQSSMLPKSTTTQRTAVTSTATTAAASRTTQPVVTTSKSAPVSSSVSKSVSTGSSVYASKTVTTTGSGASKKTTVTYSKKKKKK